MEVLGITGYCMSPWDQKLDRKMEVLPRCLEKSGLILQDGYRHWTWKAGKQTSKTMRDGGQQIPQMAMNRRKDKAFGDS
jgi:hypothetical protein